MGTVRELVQTVCQMIEKDIEEVMDLMMRKPEFEQWEVPQVLTIQEGKEISFTFRIISKKLLVH